MNKYLYFIAILVTTLFVASCTSDKKDHILSDLFPVKKDIQGEVFQLPEGVQLNMPSQLVVLDSILIISDQFLIEDDRYIFLLYDFHTDSYSIFGRLGRGPNEFYTPVHLSRIPNEPGRFGVFDRRLFTYSEISIDSLLAKSNYFTEKRYMDFDSYFSRLIKIDDTHFVGTGMFPEGRYNASDQHGEIIASGGVYPFEDEHPYPYRVKGMAYQALIASHPKESWFVSATHSSANYEILKYDENGFAYINKTHLYPAVFENASTENSLRIINDPDNIEGFKNIDTTQEYIYLLYSGKKYKEDQYWYGNKVFVIDWEGEPVIQFNLNQDVTKITVDANNELLYAATSRENGDSEILIYTLDF